MELNRKRHVFRLLPSYQVDGEWISRPKKSALADPKWERGISEQQDASPPSKQAGKRVRTPVEPLAPKRSKFT